ncbi:DUF120 domain-containing protein [Thermodesulfobacteriota bacterium]
MRELRGKILSGVQKAAQFTQLDWVRKQCLEKLGFIPFPGTVNLEIKKGDISTLNALRKEEGVRLIPPDPQFCESKAFPITVGHIQGALIIPEENVRVHGRAVIEIMAPVRVKDALDVEDGDYLSLELKKIKEA